MCRTTSGFEIAKEDLKIRGAGDVLGTKQSGQNADLQLILAYPKEYAAAQKAAIEIIDSGISCPLFEKVLEEAEADALESVS